MAIFYVVLQIFHYNVITFHKFLPFPIVILHKDSFCQHLKLASVRVLIRRGEGEIEAVKGCLTGMFRELQALQPLLSALQC